MTYKEFSASLSDAQRKFLEERFNENLESAEKLLAFIEDTEADSEFYSFHFDAGEYIKSASTFKNLLCDPELNECHKVCLYKFLTMGEA